MATTIVKDSSGIFHISQTLSIAVLSVTTYCVMVSSLRHDISYLSPAQSIFHG